MFFHAGLPFDLARLVCVALGEQLLHGYDVATAVGRPWPIDPAPAQPVLYGYGHRAVDGAGVGISPGSLSWGWNVFGQASAPAGIFGAT